MNPEVDMLEEAPCESSTDSVEALLVERSEKFVRKGKPGEEDAMAEADVEAFVVSRDEGPGNGMTSVVAKTIDVVYVWHGCEVRELVVSREGLYVLTMLAVSTPGKLTDIINEQGQPCASDIQSTSRYSGVRETSGGIRRSDIILP